MSALPAIVDRLRMRAVIVDRRGSSWAVGRGLIAFGHIDADAAAIALADRLDLMVVRT